MLYFQSNVAAGFARKEIALKIPEPKKLPSGSWRIQMQVNGKKYSITDKDKKVVKRKW